MVSRYYQLLSGHAAIGSFHYDRMTGLLRRESSECQWCGAGARESHHHIFAECKAWVQQRRRLWERVAKDCGWRRPRAPAVRKLWNEGATEAVLEFLKDTRAGCYMLVVGWGDESAQGGAGGRGEAGGR